MKNYGRITWLLALLLLYNGLVSAQTKRDLPTFEEFEAKLKTAAKTAQILDARLPEEYAQNHLAGSVNFNVNNQADFEKESAKLDKNRPVFIYSIGNGRSGKLAENLRANGFKDVTELPGGLSKWIGLGRPVISTVGKGLSLAEYTAAVTDNRPVLVDFGSRYCGSCKRVAPIVDSLKTENASTLKVLKVEAYENKDLTKVLGIVSLPTLILYKNNQIVWKKSGVISKAEIEKILKSQAL